MRTLAISLVNSSGTRERRLEIARDAMSRLSGRYCAIYLPDSPDFYLAGYVDVREQQNDLNRTVIEITASVDPYFEARLRTLMDLEAKSTTQGVVIKNRGGRKVIPAVSAYMPGGGAPSVTLHCGSFELTLTDGISRYPEELALAYLGERLIEYHGTGRLVIAWQEARL